jgi:hypothetical protein
MRSILTATALVALFAALGLAESFSGRLIDASCAEQERAAAACTPTSSTTAFAVQVSAGKIYKLDADGNAKAAEALKNRADRQAEPNATQKSAIVARVNGTLEGNTIKVESIEVQ